MEYTTFPLSYLVPCVVRLVPLGAGWSTLFCVVVFFVLAVNSLVTLARAAFCNSSHGCCCRLASALPARRVEELFEACSLACALLAVCGYTVHTFAANRWCLLVFLGVALRGDVGLTRLDSPVGAYRAPTSFCLHPLMECMPKPWQLCIFPGGLWGTFPIF